MTIAAATRCVSTSVSFVATSVDRTRSGTTDSAVSASVTLTKAARGWLARRRRTAASATPIAVKNNCQLTEAEHGDLLPRRRLERDAHGMGASGDGCCRDRGDEASGESCAAERGPAGGGPIGLVGVGNGGSGGDRGGHRRLLWARGSVSPALTTSTNGRSRNRPPTTDISAWLGEPQVPLLPRRTDSTSPAWDQPRWRT